MIMQNFTLSAAVHEFINFLPYLAMVNNTNIQSCDHDL